MAIVDEGQIIAIGTPREIQQRTLGQCRIEIAVRAADARATRCPRFEQRRSIRFSNDRKIADRVFDAPGPRPSSNLVKWIDQHGIELEDIHLKRPTLEDVFIELTGKRLRE